MRLAAYVARRLALLVFTFLVISLLISGLMNLLPGDAVEVIVGNWAKSSGSDLARLRASLGLDLPWYEQYFRWLAGMARGEFGDSIALRNPAMPEILGRLQNSLLLAAPAFIIAVSISLTAGVWTALRQGKLADNAVLLLTLLGISIPAFVVGPLLVVVFSGWLRWLPASSTISPDAAFAERVLLLILPVATIVIEVFAHITRTARGSMIEVMRTPYVRMAQLKGLPPKTVVTKHALRNALAPTVTVIALNVGWLIGGVVVIEQVFSYPGIGSLLIFAIDQRDLPLLRLTVFVIAAIYCSANLVADVIHALLDPRVLNG